MNLVSYAIAAVATALSAQHAHQPKQPVQIAPQMQQSGQPITQVGLPGTIPLLPRSGAGQTAPAQTMAPAPTQAPQQQQQAIPAQTTAQVAPTTYAQFARVAYGRTVTVCLDGQSIETVFAGKMAFRDATHSWGSYCADVRSPISEGQYLNMTPMSTQKMGGNLAKAGNIVAANFDDANTPDKCAGLQIAVWEALEDGGQYPDFLGGKFQVQANQSVISYAQKYYKSIVHPSDSIWLTVPVGLQGQITKVQ